MKSIFLELYNNNNNNDLFLVVKRVNDDLNQGGFKHCRISIWPRNDTTVHYANKTSNLLDPPSQNNDE